MNSEIIPIIILNWNGVEDTINCINSLLEQTYQDFHIYLVDNNSKGNDVEILKSNFENNNKISININSTNIGFGGANNKIIRELIQEEKYKHIALLNNDIEVDKNWLSSLVENLDKNKADFVTSKMINFYKRNEIDNAGHILLNTGEILPLGSYDEIKKYDKPREVMSASAGACIYSTKMLKDIGLFDEYFNTGYEDAELGIRATIFGYKCMYEPKAIVYHKGGVSIDKIRDYKYSLKLQKNILYTYLKLMPFQVILFNFPFIILKSFMIIFGALLFLKPLYAKLYIQAIYEVFIKERKVVLKARKNFMNKKRIAWWKLLKKQTCFIPYYFKYFKLNILGSKKSIFER